MSVLFKKVDNLLHDFFEQRTELFLISCNISSSNHISIVIDGDQSVTIQDCLDVSRKIEFNLDREQEDFSLDVSSAGLDASLQLPRQYRKNLTREISVVMVNDETYTGTLTEANEESFIVEWSERIPKEIGKGKQTVTRSKSTNYSEVKTAKINIKF